MTFRKAGVGLALACLPLFLSGCASYIPVSLEPTSLAADFRSRSLRDPRLGEFIRAAAPDFASRARTRFNLTGLTLVALYYHPELEVSRAKILQADAAVLTAAQIPNPEFNSTATLHSVTSPSAWTIGALINLLLETGGRRQLRVEQAERLVEAARLDLAAASWQVRGKVRSAMIALWAAQSKQRALTIRKNFQTELVDVLERQLVAGQVTSLMVSKERSALTQVRLSVEDVGRQSAEARVALATALGLPVSALDNVTIDYGAFNKPPQPAAVAASMNFRREAILGRTDLQVLLANYEAASAAVKLELAKQYPTLKLGPGYTYDQGDNLYSLGFSADLPIFNRNGGPIAEADSKRMEAGAKFIALQAQIIGEIDLAVAGYRSASKSLATANSLHTGEHERQRKTTRAFAAGEIDRQTLLTGELEFVAIEAARQETLTQYLNSVGLLEDALRRSLFDAGALPSLPDRGNTFLSAVAETSHYPLSRIAAD